MRRYDLISKVCDCMQTLGWGPYQNDHEDGSGQFEMNWTYSDALTTADRHAFFKYMVKTLCCFRRVSARRKVERWATSKRERSRGRVVPRWDDSCYT